MIPLELELAHFKNDSLLKVKGKMCPNELE